jgi:hypothetical protein
VIPALVEKSSEHALEVFRSLPPEDASLAGDSDAAFSSSPVRRLFSRIVREKGTEGLDLIRQEAQRLGQISHYPYSAVMASARELPADDAVSREVLFYEALAAYRQGTRSFASDGEFVLMLLQEWSRDPKTAARDAFQAVALNLVARAEQEDQQAASPTVSSASGASSAPTNSADRLLLRLLPLIKNADPDLLQKIQQARPQLPRDIPSARGRGPARFGRDSSVSSLPSAGSPARTPQFQSFLQFNQARRNPEQALTTSQALSDPLARVLTLVGAASGLARKDREGALSALQQADQTAGRLQDPAQQLQAASAIISVTAQLENRALLLSSLERGFQAAEALEQSSQESGESPPQAQFALRRLVGTAFQQDPELAVSFVDRVRIPDLKAGLLIDAAQALFRGQRRANRARSAPSNAPARREATEPPR